MEFLKFISNYLLLLIGSFLHVDLVSYNFAKFVYSRSCFADYLGFSILMTIPSANRNSFICSFPIFMILFFLLYCTNVSNTMLIRCVQSGQSCLICYLMGKTFNISPLSMMLTVGILQMPFIRLRKVFTNPNLLRFHHK